MFMHGQTYFGHPLACALALTNLELMEKENLPAAAFRIGDWFREGLAPVLDLPIVGDLRIGGAMIGIELVTSRETKEPMPFDRMVAIIDDLRNNHQVLVRDYGPTLVIGPPLILKREQAARTSAAVVEALTRASKTDKETA
jgi:putrescine aminotransferase